MFDIKFTDGKNIFTYTTYNAKLQADAEILWQKYVKEHFPNDKCKIVSIKKVI